MRILGLGGLMRGIGPALLTKCLLVVVFPVWSLQNFLDMYSTGGIRCVRYGAAAKGSGKEVHTRCCVEGS